MTLLDVKRDPRSGHYDLLLRMTEADALDLAKRIVAAAETKKAEPPPEPPPGDSESEERIG